MSSQALTGTSEQEVPQTKDGLPAIKCVSIWWKREPVRTCAGLATGWQVQDGLVQTLPKIQWQWYVPHHL